jgi:hypothetical protein
MSRAEVMEMQNLLDETWFYNAHATEETLASANGRFTGVCLAVQGMGYMFWMDSTYHRFLVDRDPVKKRRQAEYADYVVHMAEDHMRSANHAENPEHEKAIVEGIREVLGLFGYHIACQPGTLRLHAERTAFPVS